MVLNDVLKWFQKADDDYNSAIILSTAIKKHTDHICYHCTQAVEKYLKGYLVSKNQDIEKTHNLININNLCDLGLGGFARRTKLHGYADQQNITLSLPGYNNLTQRHRDAKFWLRFRIISL